MNENIKIFKALADESRVRVLNLLLIKPQCVEEIAETLDLAPSTVSFHLKKLNAAGVVTVRKEQYYAVFSPLKSKFNMRLIDLIKTEENDLINIENRLKKLKARVMKTFLKKGKIIQMPAQMKKRKILLEYIADKIEEGIEYDEKEFNELLKKYHNDYCLVRRLLAEEKLIYRNNGKYWKASPTNGAADLIKGTEILDNEIKAKAKKMADKKTLKNKYKNEKRPMGIFAIKNLKSGKILLGSSMNLPAALNKHKFELEYGSHKSKELQNDWNLSGEGAIAFEIVDYLEPKKEDDYDYKEDLETLEKLWLEKLKESGHEFYEKYK